MSSFTCAADLEKVFNIPRILNLPFSTIPQTCVKQLKNLTLHITINLNIEEQVTVSNNR